MGAKERTQCYFDVEINREPVGRIVFQLFSDICPKTCKNFLCLCTGEKGSGKTTKKKLCYKGSTFHRVVKNFMIQGGDFTEGNGRGGESIYGGFFEDENFTLKHDKAFLLSMANRGKDTNGSQFFITTKTAPHLDGVHVVFGLVISGFEVIKNIERLKTDTASRPYADVRVIDCGQLITKSANDVLQGKKSQTFDSEEDSSSSSESESEFDKKLASQKRKRRSKNKYNKRKRLQRAKESTTFDTTEDESHGKMEMEEEDEGNKNMKREKPVVRPEEIPPVPENRFLLRQDLPIQEDKIKVAAQDIIMAPNDPKPAVTKSGRKIKGRGTMRYHTPTRSQSFSESEGERGSSETPPHWKEEMQKTRVYQPPSLERWSKGEKWDDSSNTPRSRSRNDSVSEASICSHGHQSRKGKKKAKSKKSSKKQKHSKKQKLLKPKENSLSEGEMSGSSDASRKRKKTKFSRYSESSRSRFYSNSRSLSPRSQRSLNSERRYYSSRSIRNSRSYSRSWTRSYSRSRSRSKRHFRYQYRRSLAHSRSLSPSQSRYRTRSSTRSTSRYRSTTPLRSSKKKMLRSSQKSKPIEDCPKISPVFVPEESAGRVLVPNSGSVAPLPFSDSPPPSRWKPGIKPWKPTCLPKVNVNTDLVLLTNIPSESTLLETPPIIDQCCNQLKSYTPVALPTPIDTYPNVTSYWPRCSRNSQSHSRSSFSRSNSYDSGKRATKKKKKKKKHSGSHRTSHKRQKNHRGKLASPQSPVHRPKGLLVKEDKLDSLSELQTMTSKSLCVKGSVVNKNPAEWECEERTLIKTASELPVEEKERASDWRKRNVLSRCWESESDTEDPDTFLETKLLSEKEEGEASSENDDFWPVLQSKNDVEVKDLSRVGKNCDADTKNLKHKSKKAKRKHKRKKRNSSKSGSHRSKSKKLKKPQKPKEAFHWQPPLEFGEEGEEDESVAQSKPLNNSKLTSVNDGADKHLQARLVKTQGTESKDHDQVIHKSPKGKCSQVASKDVEKQKISEGKKSTVNRLNKTEIQPVEGRPGSNTSNLSDTKSTNTLFMNVDQTMTGPKQNSRLQQRQSKEKPALPTKNVFQCSNEPSQPQGEKSSPFSGTPALSPVIRPEVMPGESCFQALDKKWKPLRDMSIMQAVLPKPLNLKVNKTEYQTKSKGLKIEIKGRNRIRPGSLFDEVRKTARLNQRTRNQDSSSEEDSPPATDERSRSHNRSKSRSVSSDRSYNDSRSWSRSYTNTSRSSSRSRSRYSWRHSRSRSRSYRSRSRRRHRRRYRSRSDSDYSYSSRSRSYGRRSGSSDHSTRSYRSYSRSSSRRRSRSSRYS